MSGSDQSQNLTEETADAGQGDLSTAEVICGDWWEDQWFSPYIRARFQLQAPSARLVVRAYNPAVTGQRNGILVRIGADVLFRVGRSSSRRLDRSRRSHSGQLSI